MRVIVLGALVAAAFAAPAFAVDETVTLTLKDHKFVEKEVQAPAGKPFSLVVTNQDGTASEIESKPLRVEKVVPAGGSVTVRVRAMEPGRYRFVDEYHENTAEGFLIVK